MFALNNVETQDDYSDDTTLECPGTTELNLIVANAAVFLQYAFRSVGYSSQATVWSPEVYFPPSTYVRGRRVEQVRVRSAVKGKPAQVTIEAVS